MPTPFKYWGLSHVTRKREMKNKLKEKTMGKVISHWYDELYKS